jgi:hypothetical protein
MKLHRRQFLHLTITAGALSATSRLSWAQAYPSRPITMIVPFTASGPTDGVSRIVAEGMKASLGQTIIIENVAGASPKLTPRSWLPWPILESASGLPPWDRKFFRRTNRRPRC